MLCTAPALPKSPRKLLAANSTPRSEWKMRPGKGCRLALAARAVPAAARLLLDARRLAAAFQLCEDRRHQHVEALVLELASRRPASTECVMPEAGEPECAAHQRLRVVRVHRLDELIFRYWRRTLQLSEEVPLHRHRLQLAPQPRVSARSPSSAAPAGPSSDRYAPVSAMPIRWFLSAPAPGPPRRDPSRWSESASPPRLHTFVNDLLALATDSILQHIGGVHEIGQAHDRAAQAASPLREAAGTRQGQARKLVEQSSQSAGRPP